MESKLKANDVPDQEDSYRSEFRDEKLSRTITRSLEIKETSEGIGSRIRRCIGNRTVRCLPPFVVCEQFRVDKVGRPAHPARGIQKIAYILSGKVRLTYSPENNIELGPGDVTSLMVGKGVIRSTVAIPPDEEDSKNGKLYATGLQIFMDVPESFKRLDPSHLNLCHDDLKTCNPREGCTVTILTGSAFGEKASQMLTATPATILDCTVEPGANIEIPVSHDWNAFVYVIEGNPHVQGEKTSRHQYIEFMRTDKSPYMNRPGDNEAKKPSPDELLHISVDSGATKSARFIYVAAEPLYQPMYRQGPFVDVSMNWVYQAYDDYTERKNGFEQSQWNMDPVQPISESGTKSPSGDRSSSWNSSKPSALNHDLSKSGCSSKSERCSSTDSAVNPCDSSEEDGQGKASFPNAFPPGKINPPTHASHFNNTDSIEEQQESKVPRKREESPGRKRRQSFTGLATNTRQKRETDSDQEEQKPQV